MHFQAIQQFMLVEMLLVALVCITGLPKPGAQNTATSGCVCAFEEHTVTQ